MITLGAWLLPVTVWAGNGLNPRTPVLWEDVPCLQRVDRSVDPVLHLPYGIPREDTGMTADEVADSRTHQFFAFCRRTHPQDRLPNWITPADVDAAVATGLLDSADEVASTNVLESSPSWDDCWHRITEDDARRPIVFEAAEAGVDWETSSVPAGAYTLYGFTHEPIFNLWIARPGVVLVHDGDVDTVSPAAAITNREEIVYVGSTVTLEGCVEALPGTTITASYASTQGANDPSWQPTWVPFAEDHPVTGETFAIDLVAPSDLAGRSSMIRLDFQDPDGRSYTTYMQDGIIVLAGTDPDACDDGTGFIENSGCDDPGDDATSHTSTGNTDSDAPPLDGPNDACACSTRGSSGHRLGMLAIGMLLLGSVRRTQGRQPAVSPRRASVRGRRARRRARAPSGSRRRTRRR